VETSQTKVSAQQKIERVRKMYEVLNNGDVKGSSEFLSNDLTFYTPVFPKPLDKDGLIAASQRIIDSTDEYKIDVHDILANEDHVVAVFVVRGRRGDRVLNERGVHVMHLNSDVKIAAIWAVTDPKPHLALWGDGET